MQLFIHLQADRQMDSIDLVQSFNYLHASAFCAPSLRGLFQN